MADPFAGLGADQFYLRDGELWCEELPVAELADRFGTPLYVYSEAAIVERMDRLRAAFGNRALICYAVKSNGNLSVLSLLARLGAGFDVVSAGELARLRAAGVATEGKVVFAGVAKQESELEQALDAGILFFNVESAHELPLLERAGKRRGIAVPVAVRLNPDVDAGTHAYISTGRKHDKFGLDLEAAGRAVDTIVGSPHLQLCGYHVHLGSQVRRVEPYLEALARVLAFVDLQPEQRAAGLRYYDLGGGFGIPYGDGDPALDVVELARLMLPRLQARGLVPVLEPGRFLTAEAGLLLCRVIGSKSGSQSNFLLVDAAMNDLCRPALYQAVHPIAPVRPAAPDAPTRRFDVVGPVCESADFLARDRALPELGPGDLLAVFSAGAYGASMASNYNSRCRPAEVMVAGRAARLIRRRESYQDLWAEEIDL